MYTFSSVLFFIYLFIFSRKRRTEKSFTDVPANRHGIVQNKEKKKIFRSEHK